MTDKSVEVQIAEMRGQLTGIETSISKLESNMATKEGQAAAGVIVGRVEAALSEERAARILGDANVQKDVDSLATEVKDMKQQQENRKYLLLSALLVGALGLVTTIVSNLVNAGVGS